jgi:hypothetical protein
VACFTALVLARRAAVFFAGALRAVEDELLDARFDAVVDFFVGAMRVPLPAGHPA